MYFYSRDSLKKYSYVIRETDNVSHLKVKTMLDLNCCPVTRQTKPLINGTLESLLSQRVVKWLRPYLNIFKILQDAK